MASGVDLTLGCNKVAGSGLLGGRGTHRPRELWRISRGMFLSGRARRQHPGTHTGAAAGACLLFPEAVSEEGLGPSLSAAGMCGFGESTLERECNWVVNACLFSSFA